MAHADLLINSLEKLILPAQESHHILHARSWKHAWLSKQGRRWNVNSGGGYIHIFVLYSFYWLYFSQNFCRLSRKKLFIVFLKIKFNS